MKRDDSAEEWKIDTLEGDDESSSALSPRFFNLAKRSLGYTHTEAGLRTLCQLDEEMHDMNLILEEQKNARDKKDISWILDGEDGD